MGVRNAVRPLWSGLFSGHFAFGPSLALMDEVGYDGDYENMFYGEELMMAARLFTHGWDTYSPDVRESVCAFVPDISLGVSE
jgi:hypothetical protein